MEAFGNFIFWLIKIFLLLIGLALILGGGFCVVFPLFEKADGFAGVFTAVGLVSVLIGSLVLWAAIRIIRKTSAAQGSQAKPSKSAADETSKSNDAEGK